MSNPDIGPRCGECRLGLGTHNTADPLCDHHTPTAAVTGGAVGAGGAGVAHEDADGVSGAQKRSCGHQCETWQVLESAKGGTYCGACGCHQEADQ